MFPYCSYLLYQFVNFRLRGSGRLRGFRYFNQKWHSTDDDSLSISFMQNGEALTLCDWRRLRSHWQLSEPSSANNNSLEKVLSARNNQPNQLIGRPLIHTTGKQKTSPIITRLQAFLSGHSVIQNIFQDSHLQYDSVCLAEEENITRNSLRSYFLLFKGRNQSRACVYLWKELSLLQR